MNKLILTPKQQTQFRHTAVARAISFLGQHEDPAHTNHGQWVTDTLADANCEPGEPWCEATNIRVFKETRQNMGLADSFLGNLIITAGVQDQVNHARAVGALVPASEILAGRMAVLPGDHMVQWHPELRRYAHTGTLETAPTKASPLFTAIEGNSNTDGSREGYEVVRQHRDLRSMRPDGHSEYAFVRII